MKGINEIFRLVEFMYVLFIPSYANVSLNRRVKIPEELIE